MPTLLKYPQVIVISPRGCLNSTSAKEFERDITAALSQDDTSILIDLASVESLDSAGLMVLVSTHKLAESLGKSFRICSISSSIRIIFELTRLDQVFEILETEPKLAA